MRRIFVIIYICFSIIGFGQESDTITKNFNSRQFKPRFGLSYQKNLFAEIGVSFHRYSVVFPKDNKYLHFGWASYGFYLSSELLVRTDKTIIGPKIGYEFACLAPTNGCALGLEMTYYSDFAKGNLAITPRIGLPLGFAEIYYGYNILLNKDLNNYIGNHRFCFSININKLYWKKQHEMNEELKRKR